ncbi:hypothetical protein PYW08_012243 [Mythimna loreyi]|uniref:Uncharacterized protein n=1 Tax=Mythimna loreyi TaxID=667449 RepID=A0ACC2PZR5_9NEOP|nr:hypothetical protein PYW08_012243 [Mythimna loreyi]
MGSVEKLSMCRICLVEDVRMCVVTNKSLQQMYEKLADVPFVTEDRKPMLACLFCCTRLQQCCQLQRKCVEAEQLLAHMLREDYEQKPLTTRGHLESVGRFIITPIENISIVDDCQTVSDAVKQELAAVCGEQDTVELELISIKKEPDPENLYNSHPDVEVHHLESESEEEQVLMEIKVEKEQEISEKLRVPKREKLDPEDLYNSHPDVEAHRSELEPEQEKLLVEIKIEKELELPENLSVSETQM